MPGATSGQKAQGTTLKYTKTGTGSTAVTIGKLTSIGETSETVDELDVTTLDSTGGYREFVAGFKDGGEVAISGYYTSDAGQKALRDAFKNNETGKFEVTFPDGSGYSFNGFVKGVSRGPAEVDGAVGFGATLRVSGAITEVEAPAGT
jgi:predicted secreted protein